MIGSLFARAAREVAGIGKAIMKTFDTGLGIIGAVALGTGLVNMVSDKRSNKPALAYG